MTIEELADKLGEAIQSAPPNRTSHGYILFGMKYADELELSTASVEDVCILPGGIPGYGAQMRWGMRLVQEGCVTLNKDALWF